MISDRKRQYNRAYYAANREELRAKQADYYRQHSKEIRARIAANREARPEDPAAKRARGLDWYRRKRVADPTYFARKRAARRALEVGDVDYDYIWFRDFGVCHICGAGVDREAAEYDHVVPLSKGGPHDNANIRISHPFCNRRKGAR